MDCGACFVEAFEFASVLERYCWDRGVVHVFVGKFEWLLLLNSLVLAGFSCSLKLLSLFGFRVGSLVNFLDAFVRMYMSLRLSLKGFR